MTEPKFTKGPWSFERLKNEIEIGAETEDGHCSVAWIHMGDNASLSDIESYFNDARLIAAAPDMYKMLIYLNRRGGLGLDVHEQIQIVLTKAEGAYEPRNLRRHR